jgi:predicted enzyme related to lactoylglutathione lyase
VFFGVSHVDVPVRDLARARRFWVDGLGFGVKREAEGFIDVETGNVLVRLHATARASQPASVRLVVADPRAAAEVVVSLGGQLLYEATRTPALELVATCADPDGNQIIVWRDLSEDEYEQAPDLPMTLRWDSAAEILLKDLLGHVPALFRALARRKVTRNAEYIATQTTNAVVNRDVVVRAYILSSARITRDRLRRPLIANGFDPDDYVEEFHA